MISIRVKGLDELEQSLGSVLDAFKDYRPLWQNYIQNFVEQQTKETFASVYPGRLIRTGRYFRSITAGGSPDKVNLQTRTKFVFGTDVPYVQYLEPRFPLLTLLGSDPQFNRDIADLANQWVEDTLREVGL